MVTSLTSGGALVGALIAGLPADKYGRKFGIYAGCALFLIGSVVQAAAFSVAQMAVGRFVVGLGVGSAAMIIVSCGRLSLSLTTTFQELICFYPSPYISASLPLHLTAGG